ncbi:MAG: MFS transporter [Acidobacteriota bacterium]|nr:MFS transporter [Acidobacteriota bacterium]
MIASSSPSPRGPVLGSLLGVLRECPDYRRLYLARNASLLGDWFNLLAVLALLRELGAASASAVGTLIILKLLPVSLAGPAAGVVADRFSRKTIMIVADGARFLLVLGMFAAPGFGSAGIWLLYTLTFLQITAQAFSEPARMASVPNLVPESSLGAANALGALTWSLMYTLGAAVGGMVTSLLGWRIALAVDAASYLVSVAILARAGIPSPAPREGPGGLATWLGLRDFAAVGRYLREHPKVVALLSAKSGWGAAGAISMMLALYGERVYPLAGSPDLGIALLFVARGMGTALGPLISRRLTQEREGPLKWAIGLSFVLAGSCYAFFAGTSYLPLALGLAVLAHIGGSTVWVFSTLLLQREVPDHFRGRVFAAELGLCTAAISASTWGWGWLIDQNRVDLRQMTLGVALTMFLAAVGWMLALFAARRAGLRVRSAHPWAR